MTVGPRCKVISSLVLPSQQDHKIWHHPLGHTQLFNPISIFKDLFVFYVYDECLAYLYVWVPCTCRGQKNQSEPLRVLPTRAQVLWKTSVLHHRALSPTPNPGSSFLHCGSAGYFWRKDNGESKATESIAVTGCFLSHQRDPVRSRRRDPVSGPGLPNAYISSKKVPWNSSQPGKIS